MIAETPVCIERRVHLVAADPGAEAPAALLAGDDAHLRGLADDDRLGRRHPREHRLDQRRGADAADLLVAGQREEDRAAEAGGEHLRDERERDGAEALHVAGAAAVQAAGALGEAEGIAGPVLAGDRDDVGVAGEDDAAGDRRADEGEEARLLAGLVGQAERGHAELGEVGLDEVDEVEVRAGRDRREGDEAGQHLARVEPGGHVRSFPARSVCGGAVAASSRSSRLSRENSCC